MPFIRRDEPVSEVTFRVESCLRRENRGDVIGPRRHMRLWVGGDTMR
jgi:hypothetical protein